MADVPFSRFTEAVDGKQASVILRGGGRVVGGATSTTYAVILDQILELQVATFAVTGAAPIIVRRSV